jgi:CheY-like chemotaxis protein
MKPPVESMVLFIGDDSRLSGVFSNEAPHVNLCMARSREEVGAHPLPQLILLDLDLPQPSAFEVLSWLRAERFYEKIPVIALTSSEDASIVNRAYALGANSCLVKSQTATSMDGIARGIGSYAALLQQSI